MSFSIITKISEGNNEEVADAVRFKVRFRDLVGHLYEQEFEFEYNNYIAKGFSGKSFSSVPKLVKEMIQG